MGWTPAALYSAIIVPSRGLGLFRLSTSKKESEMNLTTIAVDLAKDVFQVGMADHRSGEKLCTFPVTTGCSETSGHDPN